MFVLLTGLFIVWAFITISLAVGFVCFLIFVWLGLFCRGCFFVLLFVSGLIVDCYLVLIGFVSWFSGCATGGFRGFYFD